jgi:hypothetical protein
MTAGRGQVPRRIKKKGTGFKGLSMRELAIACLGLPLALMAGIGLVGLPVWLRAGLAVLIAGVTLALAFGTHQGKTFEQWLHHWIAHRVRARRMAWRRGGEPIPPVAMEVPAAPAAPPAPTPIAAVAPVEAEARDWVNLWFALVNAVMLAAMTSLTVYLADGGAEELRLWLLYKLRH